MPQPSGDTRHEHDFMKLAINPSPSGSELAVLFSGEGRPHPLHTIGPAIHDYVLVHTVLAGRGVYEVRGHAYPCRAGDSFIIFPGELFSYQADEHEPWHYVWVSFVGPASRQLLANVGVTPDCPIVSGSSLPDIRMLYRSLQDSLSPAGDAPLADLESAGWLRLLLGSFGRANGAGRLAKPDDTTAIDRQIEQAIRFMSLHYTQQVSIDQLSRTLGYHRTHLSRMFKRTTGLSPKQYLMTIRLERAQTLLASTAMPIDQVASAVGFNDPLYFSKKFKSATGFAPSDYRKTALSVKHEE
ncbi:transcriptional regulator, AraC family [Paenibacillus curdlanolyticus YK9]|uniref:Transcriptional regulator, AraC family n=1 Tax=Paenibacillus curdlanolyticus YK9 TaxID=717606 RepID=E0I7X3_9BACL|nr:AraC family transcriptional regulator [Paenibacillus curdlanolyticus]EFM11278.1 transcriptional regulator, AraC family [Paenibacillus curdlanolyticus YK9]